MAAEVHPLKVIQNKKVQIRLSPALYRQLDLCAQRRSLETGNVITLAWVMRTALAEYLLKHQAEVDE